MADTLPPADWFPDPTARHEQRWWDGAAWTEHVFSAGAQSVDPLDRADEAPRGPGSEPDTSTPQPSAPDAPDAPGAWDDTPVGEGTASAAHEELRALADQAIETIETEDGAGAGPQGTAAPDGARDGWFLLDAPVRVAPDRTGPGPTEAAGAEPDPERGPDRAPVPREDERAPTPARAIPGGFVAGRPAPNTPGDAAPTPDGPAPASAVPAGSAPPRSDPGAADVQVPAVATTDVPPTTGRVTGPLVDAEREVDGSPVGLENRRMLRVRLDGGSVLARQGSMVAHRGELDVRHEAAGGVGRVLRRAATGEGVRMMRVSGDGQVFLADGARHVFLLHLEGDAALSVSGRSVLAFSDGLAWQVERVRGATVVGGGLFATTLRGDGWVALVSDGEPVVLRSDDAPVLVDTQALVAWTSGLATSVSTSVKLPALVGLGSGEAVQLRFSGQGLVVVQPSEGRTGDA